MPFTPSVMDRVAVDHTAAPEPPEPTQPKPEPTQPEPGPDALNDFIRSTHAWQSSPVPLSRKATRALLILAPLNADAAVVSLAKLRGRFDCDSLLCSTTTLGDNAAFVATLSGIYLIGLIALALITHGLAQINGAHLAAVAVLAVIGTVAAAGAVMAIATVTAVLVAMIAALSLLLLATGRFRPTTPHR